MMTVMIESIQQIEFTQQFAGSTQKADGQMDPMSGAFNSPDNT